MRCDDEGVRWALAVHWASQPVCRPIREEELAARGDVARGAEFAGLSELQVVPSTRGSAVCHASYSATYIRCVEILVSEECDMRGSPGRAFGLVLLRRDLFCKIIITHDLACANRLFGKESSTSSFYG